MEQATASLFFCDQCDYTNTSEKGLRQHKRMKHGKPQLATQLQSSSPSTPENLRKQTSCSDALAVSPVGDSTGVIPCNNCDEDMSPNHICSTHTCKYCEEEFNCEDDLESHLCYPFKCDYCGVALACEDELENHSVTELHTTRVMMQCDK